MTSRLHCRRFWSKTMLIKLRIFAVRPNDNPGFWVLQAVISLLNINYFYLTALFSLPKHKGLVHSRFDNVKQVAPSYILQCLKSFNNLHNRRLKTFGNTIQLHHVLYSIYSEIICILIDKELRNLTLSKLLKFIMQDLSKTETCILSLQEATNHWLLLN